MIEEILEFEEPENGEKKKSNVITTTDGSFYIIYKNDPLLLDELLLYDAVIIESGDIFRTSEILRRFRSHFNPEFYLKPIFVLGESDNTDTFIENLIDGHIMSLDQMDIVAAVFKKIFLKTTELYFPKTLSFESQIITNLINFLFTREKKTLLPHTYVRSAIGYTFPAISVNFAPEEEWKAVEILEIATKEGLFMKSFHEKIHLCPKCKSGFLSFREVCPKCHSSNLSVHDLIHHFPCAYVGPIYDFKSEIEGQLVCPKCYKHLRHIGVDYDKPSVISTCNECGHHFQDSNVKAKCINCSAENTVEDLLSEVINKYQLTKKGELVALKGYMPTEGGDFNSIRGLLDLKTFKIIVAYEIERLRQSDMQSNIAIIRILHASDLYAKMGPVGQKKFLDDLITLIRLNLRTSDLVSLYDASIILLALNDISTRTAGNIIHEISDMLIVLINENYSQYNIEIANGVRELHHTMSAEIQINGLLDDLL
jgi:hypothetical protein